MYFWLILSCLAIATTREASGVFRCTNTELQKVLGTYSSMCQLYFSDSLSLSAELAQSAHTYNSTLGDWHRLLADLTEQLFEQKARAAVVEQSASARPNDTNDTLCSTAPCVCNCSHGEAGQWSVSQQGVD